MEKQEQLNFINGLIDDVKEEILKKVDSDKIPDHWDGFELRQYIADKFSEAAYVKMSKGRKREYNNTILVNNL